MKVGGKEFKTSAWEPDPLVLDRGRDADGNRQFLVFRARGIKSFDEFNQLCPKPKNTSGYLTPDGWTEDPRAPQYLDALNRWRDQRWAYTVIKTLEPSEIEWTKVALNKPKTWHHYEEEIGQLLNYAEQALLVDLVQTANALDAQKLEENRQTFFHQAAKSPSTATGQDSDQESTTSGVHASEQESCHQG